jgi:hypothetical protein
VLGGDYRFFAADPDFQVVTLDDPRAYPQSTTRFRQTMIASSNGKGAYAVSVFEVHGGLQHDQLFHAAPGSTARWQVSVPMAAGPATLLPPTIPYVPTARADDGRWFVQAYGEFRPHLQARFERPATAWLAGADAPGVRLHVLGDLPVSVFTVTSPDPSAATGPGGRAGLILRRRSVDGATLKSTFVTIFEPITTGVSPARFARMPAPPGMVAVSAETADGVEHLLVNLEPGTIQSIDLGDGQRLRTDGRVVRFSKDAVVLAGGTFLEPTYGRVLRHETAAGRITGVVRRASGSSRGWFETATTFADPASLAGRVLLIEHGDGTTRGWTVDSVENTPTGSRVHVREEPGFALDSERNGPAHYYQFPRIAAPGPHRFRVSKMSR